MRETDVEDLIQELANVATFLLFMKHFMACQRPKEELELIEVRLKKAMDTLSKELDNWMEP